MICKDLPDYTRLNDIDFKFCYFRYNIIVIRKCRENLDDLC